MNLALITLFIGGGICIAFAQKTNGNDDFAKDNKSANCEFLSSGKNDYFILEPGYQEILEGGSENKKSKLVITVLKETKKVGDVETRVVEENESLNGEPVEISRNYFAVCKQTNAIYYFGEDVDIYKNGKVVNHNDSWLAVGKNKPGIQMPGKIVLGDKYYQEIAPKVAMDRAEILSNKETFETPAGKFENVLKTKETTPLDPLEKEFKLYAPGVGLIQDENMLLVKYGYVK